MFHGDGKMVLVELQLLVRQERRLTQGIGVQDGARAKLQGLETLVGVRDILAHQHDTVVLHDDGLVFRILAELRGDLLTQRLTARHIVRGETDRAADVPGLRKDAGIRNLVDDAEGHQARRVGMDDGMQARPHLVQRAVERIFGGRAVGSDDAAVGLDAHDVGGGQRTLVDAGGGDPHVTVVVHDGQVAAGSGGHPAAIDAPDDQGDLLGRMHQSRVQLLHFDNTI